MKQLPDWELGGVKFALADNAAAWVTAQSGPDVVSWRRALGRAAMRGELLGESASSEGRENEGELWEP